MPKRLVLSLVLVLTAVVAGSAIRSRVNPVMSEITLRDSSSSEASGSPIATDRVDDGARTGADAGALARSAGSEFSDLLTMESDRLRAAATIYPEYTDWLACVPRADRACRSQLESALYGALDASTSGCRQPEIASTPQALERAARRACESGDPFVRVAMLRCVLEIEALTDERLVNGMPAGCYLNLEDRTVPEITMVLTIHRNVVPSTEQSEIVERLALHADARVRERVLRALAHPSYAAEFDEALVRVLDFDPSHAPLDAVSDALTACSGPCTASFERLLTSEAPQQRLAAIRAIGRARHSLGPIAVALADQYRSEQTPAEAYAWQRAMSM